MKYSFWHPLSLCMPLILANISLAVVRLVVAVFCVRARIGNGGAFNVESKTKPRIQINARSSSNNNSSAVEHINDEIGFGRR